MSTLSQTIHAEVAKIEAWFEELFGRHGTAAAAPPHVMAAIASIKAQANAVDPKQPAATVQPSAPAERSAATS